MEGLDEVIREHPFFRDLDPRFVSLVVGCARNVRFDAGQYLFREGGPADQFYLLRHGHVALEMVSPTGGALTFQTLGEGDIVGLSWFVSPYRWAYDARAIELTRAVSLDAVCLRSKLDEDHDLGYEVMQRFVPVLIERLQGTRLQMLDVYGHSRAGAPGS
ncbi:MAG: cyclic nucleotide-binding domain-containing protein [Betaproteobacteria bacterium]|nr:cyclic nucleotide-binding domain-containing protein [Betaproteobacteria bacterium]